MSSAGRRVDTYRSHALKSPDHRHTHTRGHFDILKHDAHEKARDVRHTLRTYEECVCVCETDTHKYIKAKIERESKKRSVCKSKEEGRRQINMLTRTEINYFLQQLE